MLDKYPNTEYCCIGSIGKKKDGEYNGDIDIAVKADNIENLEKIINDVFGYTETVTSKSYYIVSIKYPYQDILDNDKIKFAAVDFMLMKDKEYTEFRYYCPDYRKNESKYKVGVKIMWANTILNHCNKERLNGVNEEEGECGSLRFVPDGLWQTIFKPSENFKVISKNFITTDVDKIVNMVFDDGDRSHFNSVETLWEGIHSEHYKYPEELKSLELSLMTNSYRKSWDEQINPRDFNFKYWTCNRIEEIFEYYKKEKMINKLLDKENGVF